jgi:hypothetical protein
LTLVHRIAPPNDRSHVLFDERRMMRREPALIALLRKQTDVPMPASPLGEAVILMKQ